MKKSERETVRLMFGGRCAYCGCELGGRWHVDHIEPLLRGFRGRGGLDAIANMYPACSECNLFKTTYSVEEFRRELSKQVYRARRYSRNFRMSEKYGLVKVTGADVVFYFEKSEVKS